MSRTITNRWFGDITIVDGEAWVDASVELNGRMSDTHVFVLPGTSDDDALWSLSVAALNRLDEFDSLARAQLADRLASEDPIVCDWLDFHLEELPEVLPMVEARASDAPRTWLLDRLTWTGVMVGGDENGVFETVMDYKVPGAVTDEILCVGFDGDGRITRVSHES